MGTIAFHVASVGAVCRGGGRLRRSVASRLLFVDALESLRALVGVCGASMARSG